MTKLEWRRRLLAYGRVTSFVDLAEVTA